MIETIFKSNRKLVEINPKYLTTIDQKSVENNAKEIGKYPLVVFRNIRIPETDILLLRIINDKFLPEIIIKFKDRSNKFIDPEFPLDNEIISIFINTSDVDNYPIRMDYKIFEFNPSKVDDGEADNIVYSCTGVLDVDELYYSDFASYENNSFNVLKQLAQEANLGFASNIQATDDKQIWINPAMAVYEFIYDTTKNAYKSDASFMWSFVDFYYNLNFIDLEIEMNENSMAYQNTNNVNGMYPDEQENTKTPLMLTNHPDNAGTNMYISRYNILNESLKVNLDIGYNKEIRYYDRNEEKLHAVKIDTISTVGTDENNIVLKDMPGQNKGLTMHALWNDYVGKIDTDNVHKNFLYIQKQNEINIKYLQKIRMVIIIKKPNFNLFRYQLVHVKIYKMNDMNNTEIKSTSSTNKEDYEDKINQRLSGDWLITGINFVFSKENGIYQELTLVRRELSEKYIKK